MNKNIGRIREATTYGCLLLLFVSNVVGCRAQKPAAVTDHLLCFTQTAPAIQSYGVTLDGKELLTTPDSSYTLYVQTLRTTELTIDSMLVGQQYYTALSSRTGVGDTCIGENQKTQQPVCLKARPATRWSVFQLQKSTGRQTTFGTASNSFKVWGKKGAVPFSMVVSKQVQLVSGVPQ